MSNTSSNQKRNLQPTASTTSAYSASPSQLTLSSDASAGAFPNPYQHYTYAPGPHNPAGFGFPTQYTHQLQTQHPPQLQHQLSQSSQHSPTNSRKRRASDISGDPSSLGSAGSNVSSFPNATGLVGTGEGDLGFGVGGPSQPPLPSPVAKKGRTNTPWTPAEEQRLKALRDAGSSWSEIAKTFPLRTEGSVKKHWYKDMHYAEFAEDEVSNFVRLTAALRAQESMLTSVQSAALLQAIKDYENNKWKVIGQKVGKPAKACEQFAKEQGWKV